MTVLEVAQKIQDKINELEGIRPFLKSRGLELAHRKEEFEKALALTIIGLLNGEEFMFEGKKIKDPAKTLIEKISNGICFRERLAMNEAEALFKSVSANADIVCSELVAWQSINKYLDKV
jgi:hypothetical protein